MDSVRICRFWVDENFRPLLKEGIPFLNSIDFRGDIHPKIYKILSSVFRSPFLSSISF